MQNELDRIVRELGKTVIFVTHDMEEAASISDRVVVIELASGRLLATFTSGFRDLARRDAQSPEFGELKDQLWEPAEKPSRSRSGERARRARPTRAANGGRARAPDGGFASRALSRRRADPGVGRLLVLWQLVGMISGPSLRVVTATVDGSPPRRRRRTQRPS